MQLHTSLTTYFFPLGISGRMTFLPSEEIVSLEGKESSAPVH